MRIAIGLIGHSGTGKTTLATALAQAIPGASIASFGDAVRSLAKSQGKNDRDRDVLMNLGQNWVDTDVVGYCRAVLGQQREGTDVLIIEGIRHEIVRSTLRGLLEQVDFACVLLKAPYDVLVERITSDDTTSTDDVQRVLNHPTETQVDQLLLGAADLIVDATNPVPQNVGEVLVWLAARERRASGGQPPDYFPESEPDVFDTVERADVINAVSAEFDVLLLKEVSERVNRPVSELLELRAQQKLIALDFGGQILVPGFQVSDGGLDPLIADVVHLLRQEMTSWEVLAWTISNNGLLDDKRPLDLPRDRLIEAARLELDA